VLRVEDVRKSYPGFVLRATLEVPLGQTLALLGPSGSGKSTLLRLVAGLETPEAGRITFGDTDLTPLPPERRGVGLVFQDYALFPHLTVYENIAFGLRERRWNEARIESRVREMLELTHLSPHARKRPEALSGGERQRVALARALAPEPRLLLLDEPLGALDLRLREELLLELRDILRRTTVTALVVTHDQAEAFLLADRVTVLRAGRVVQSGSPEGLYLRPQDVWTARFLGHRNVLSAPESRSLGLPEVPHLVPPAALEIGEGHPARVLERLFYGSRVGLWLEFRGLRLYWEGPDPGLKEGQATGLTIRFEHLLALNEEAA